MIVCVGDLENRRSVESRFDNHLAPFSILAPQFQLPAVLVLPAFVQVNQKRKAPNEPRRVGCIAVHMNIELSAPWNKMVPGPLQVGIGQQLPALGLSQAQLATP